MGLHDGLRGDRHAGAVYLSGSADLDGAVHALDIRTGRALWQSADHDTHDTWGPAGGLVYATPADGQRLLALDTAAGRVRWTTNTARVTAVAANASAVFLADADQKSPALHALRAR